MEGISKELVIKIVGGIFLIGLFIYLVIGNINNNHMIDSCTEKTVSSSVETRREIVNSKNKSRNYETRYDHYAKYTYKVNDIEYENEQMISKEMYNDLEKAKVIDNILYNPDKASESYIEGTFVRTDGLGTIIYFSPILIIVGVIGIKRIMRKKFHDN